MLIGQYTTLLAKGRFEVTSDVQSAYTAVMSLRFDEAKRYIKKSIDNDPENLLIYHIENYIDFLTIFINEDENHYDQLLKNKELRLNKIQQGDPNSPYYKFSQAEILLQWALLKTKFFSKAKTLDFEFLRDANQAYRLLEANVEDHPDFVDNKKSLSVIHALAGYLPGFVKFVFKVKGNLSSGREEIEEVISHNDKNPSLFADEARAIYAYMLLHLYNQPETAWNVLSDSKMDTEDNLLACFLYSSIGMKTGRNDYVIDILNNRPHGKDYFPFPYLNLVLGKAKLHKLDPTAASDINLFLSEFKGRHFIKDAYQKLGWYEIALNNSITGYRNQLNKCIKQGHLLLEDDQQAQQEAKSNFTPNNQLLKARLLYDGGYYDRALSLLLTLQESNYNSHDLLEYYYRLARVYHATGKSPEAIRYYTTCIAIDKKKSTFIACNAALQIGFIYEDAKNYRLARQHFNTCLDIDPEAYESQLHNKAKTALDRIKSKN